MRPVIRVRLAMAAVVPLLVLASSRLVAQDVWPPDDETPPPQQSYPSPGYGEQPGQQPYAQPAPYEQKPSPYNYGQDPYAQAAPSYGQQSAAPYGQQAYGDPNGYQPQYAQGLAPTPTQQPMSPDQLEQMLAPIALYPDTLLAQVLTAATYPAQISAADQWMRGMGNAPPEQIAAA